MSTSTSLEELEAAASDVLQILKAIPEFSSLRVAVIGGLALWKYLPEYRTTKDVDLIINLDTAPSGVKNKLLRLYPSSFIESAQFFQYKSPDGQLVQIDICASRQSPYLPSASRVLSDIPNRAVPYISAKDLVIFKINSCGLRAQPAKAARDATDALALLDLEFRSAPLNLTPVQKSIVEEGLMDVIKYTGKSEVWWKERLGL